MNTQTPSSAAEAVANGAQLLDEKSPGWWRKINLQALKLCDCGACVCGQLAWEEYGSTFHDGGRYRNYLTEKLGLDDVWGGAQNSTTHGFGAARNVTEWTYEDLDEEWHKVITARLEADVLPAHEEPEVALVV